MITTTTIFQHANVAARMVTGAAPHFEITVDGELAQTVPATRAWQAEKKAVVAAAQTLAGVTPAEAAPVVRTVAMARRLHNVASGFIAQLGYSAKRHELTLVFRSGLVYIYTDVTLAEFNKLRRAHSVGKAYHAIIRAKKAGFALAA